MALAARECNRGWKLVTRYSGATVPDFHGVPGRLAAIRDGNFPSISKSRSFLRLVAQFAKENLSLCALTLGLSWSEESVLWGALLTDRLLVVWPAMELRLGTLVWQVVISNGVRFAARELFRLRMPLFPCGSAL